MGCPTDLIAADAQRGYQLSLDDLANHWHRDTGAVLVASPSNPTGTLVDPEDLRAIERFVHDRGGHLIVDEIYQSLIYGQAPTTALAHGQPWIVNSFSKYFGLTGLRLGWLVCPPGTETAVINMAQHLFISPAGISQAMALACFEPAQCLSLNSVGYSWRRPAPC